MSATVLGNESPDRLKALDEAARHYLNLSAEEFREQWSGGNFRGRQACSDPRIAYIASLIPDAVR